MRAGPMAACHGRRGNDQGNDQDHGEEDAKAKPADLAFLGDIAANGLQALGVSVRFFVTSRDLRRDGAELPAMAQRAIGEIIASERDLA